MDNNTTDTPRKYPALALIGGRDKSPSPSSVETHPANHPFLELSYVALREAHATMEIHPRFNAIFLTKTNHLRAVHAFGGEL